jgi:TP901 family phage tail tape measure protein
MALQGPVGVQVAGVQALGAQATQAAQQMGQVAQASSGAAASGKQVAQQYADAAQAAAQIKRDFAQVKESAVTSFYDVSGARRGEISREIRERPGERAIIRQRDAITTSTTVIEDKAKRIKQEARALRAEQEQIAAWYTQQWEQERKLTIPRASPEEARLRILQRQAAVEDKLLTSRQRVAAARATYAGFAAQPGAETGTVEILNRATGKMELWNTVTNKATGLTARFNQQTGQLTARFRDLSGEAERVRDSMQNAIGKVALWTLATGAVYGTIRVMGRAVATFKEMELGTVALARVARGFGDTQEQQMVAAHAATGQILELAHAYGQSAQQGLEAAMTFARMGLSQRDTLEAVRVSMMASNVAFIGLTEAASLLSSAMVQFGLSVRDLPTMLNRLNTLENTTKVTTQDMLQAISRSGSVWAEAGGDMESLAATTAVVAQATSRSGGEIGNALKTISSRLVDARIQAMLFERAGVAIADVEGNLKPIMDVVGELAVRMMSLGKAESAALTTQLAGIRQRNVLQSLLNNYISVQGQVIRQYAITSSAERENAMVMSTLSKETQQLLASFTKLATVIGDSGLGQILRVLVGLLDTVVRGFASLGGLGTFLLATIAAYVAKILLVGITNTAFGTTFKTLRAAITGVNASILESIGIHTAAVGSTGRLVAANAALTRSYGAVAGASAIATRTTAGATALNIVGTGARAGPVGLAVTGVALAAYGAYELSSYMEKGREREYARQREEFRKTVGEIDKASQVVGERVGLYEHLSGFLKLSAAFLDEIARAEAAGTGNAREHLRVREQILNVLRDNAKYLDLTPQQAGRLRDGILEAPELSDMAVRAAEKAAKLAEDKWQKDEASLHTKRAQLDVINQTLEREKQIEEEAEQREAILREQGLTRLSAPRDLAPILADRAALEKDIADLEKTRGESLGKHLENSLKLAALQVEKDWKEAFRNIGREADLAFSIWADFEGDSVKAAAAKLAEAAMILERTRESPAFKTWASLAGNEQEAKDLIRKLSEAREKSAYESEKAIIKRRAELHRRELEDAAVTGKVYYEILYGGGSERTRGVRMAEANAQQIQDELMELRRREAILRAQLDPGATTYRRLTGGGGPPVEGAETVASLGMSVEEYGRKLAELNAVTERRSSLEVDAGRAVNDIRVQGLRLMQRQNEEMQKQYESTLKQLGAMDDVELIQTRILAGRLAKGEIKPLSTGEWWSAPQQTRQMLGRFGEMFGGESRLYPQDLRLPRGLMQPHDEPPQMPDLPIVGQVRGLMATSRGIKVSLDAAGLGTAGDALTTSLQLALQQTMNGLVAGWVEQLMQPVKRAKPAPKVTAWQYGR